MPQPYYYENDHDSEGRAIVFSNSSLVVIRVHISRIVCLSFYLQTPSFLRYIGSFQVEVSPHECILNW
jgi:hypothetical protein